MDRSDENIGFEAGSALDTLVLVFERRSAWDEIR